MIFSRLHCGIAAASLFVATLAPLAHAATVQALPPLTWRPPALNQPLTLQIIRGGTYDLRSDTDYVVSALR